MSMHKLLIQYTHIKVGSVLLFEVAIVQKA